MFCSHSHSKSTGPYAIWICLIIGICGSAVQSWSQQDAEAQLRKRLEAYWKAMEEADYETAAQFIDPDTRSVFRDRVPKSRMGHWKIDKLECNPDRTVCEVTTLVHKTLPMFGAEIDWPLHNQWVLRDGDWYFKLPWKENENPFLEAFKTEQQMTVHQPETTADVKPPNPQDTWNSIRKLTEDPQNPTRVHFGQKSVFRFLYTNTGSKPVRITSVHADCHCLGMRKDYPEIAPGQSETIEITLDTFGLPLGPLEREIQVGLSDQETPLTIRLRVTNEPNFEVLPVDFGTVALGKVGLATGKVINKSGQTIRILSSMNSDPRLHWDLRPTTIGPGEEMILSLRYDAASAGEFMDSVIIRTDLSEEPLLNVRIRGKVEP